METVKRFYENWARGELLVESLDPEVEYVNPAGAAEPGTRHGLEEFQTAVGKVTEAWETWEIEPERYRVVEDQVAVVVRYRARGRASGVEIGGRESALMTLREGKITRYEWFHGPADAFQAAGLPE